MNGNHKRQPQTATMETRAKPCLFPPEIWLNIVSNLDDFKHLYDAALICKTVLACAGEVKQRLILGTVDRALLPEAFAAAKSACFRRYNDRAPIADFTIGYFLNAYKTTRPAIPDTISFSEGDYICRLHRQILHLSQKFMDKAVQRLYEETVRAAAGQPVAQQQPGTADEATRVRRAMYRFEMHCNLFRDRTAPYSRQAAEISFQRMHFFQGLTNWECEQFVAVVEFFAADVIRGPLLTLATALQRQHEQAIHDGPPHGSLHLDVLPAKLNRKTYTLEQDQFYLVCHGVGFLYKVSTSPRAAFHGLLDALPPALPSTLGHRHAEFGQFMYGMLFCDRLMHYYDESHMVPNIYLGGLTRNMPLMNKPPALYTDLEYRLFIRTSLVVDEDDWGSERAWLWTYGDAEGQIWCADPALVNLRRFGLVFWDNDRLDLVNFMGHRRIRWQGMANRQRDYKWDIDEAANRQVDEAVVIVLDAN